MKNILIIGMSLLGRKLAKRFTEKGCEVMVIDKEEELVNKVSGFVANCQIGDSTDKSFLQSLGVENFDLCIVAVGSNFQVSLVTTLLLKELGAKFIIARAVQDIQKQLLEKNGANKVIFYEEQISDWLSIKYSTKNIFEYTELEGDYAICEVAVPEHWIGKTIVELDIRNKYHINVIGVNRTGVPNYDIKGDLKFQMYDKIEIICNKNMVNEIYKVK